MSSFAVFPPQSLQEYTTLREYNSSLITGDHTKGNNPSLYTFGQVRMGLELLIVYYFSICTITVYFCIVVILDMVMLMLYNVLVGKL